ncbi:hypothetical protein B0H14DRAFT_3736208 [Mycena olivaceomarginata]|nr:hypothetical protein B0H14DRAFT_3736208 [Mycena olivaceomarginata]
MDIAEFIVQFMNHGPHFGRIAVALPNKTRHQVAEYSLTPFAPGPIISDDGEEHLWLVKDIIAERRIGRGRQYLVQYLGYDSDSDLWLPGAELAQVAALDRWEARHNVG